MPVIRWLKALNLPFVMPAIIRGKQGGTRQLLKGRKSYFTVYTLSGSYGAVECNMGVVCRYQRGQRLGLYLVKTGNRQPKISATHE